MRFGKGTVAHGSSGVREAQRESVRRDVAAPRKERKAGKALDRKGRRNQPQHPARSEQWKVWGQGGKPSQRGKVKPLGTGKKSNKGQCGGNKGPVRVVTREPPRGGCITRGGGRLRHEAPLTCWQAPGRECLGQEARPPDLPQHAPPPPTHRPASPQALRPKLMLLPIPNSCALEVEAKSPEEGASALQTQQTSKASCRGVHGKSSSVKHEQVGNGQRQEKSSSNKEKREARKRFTQRRKTKRREDRKDGKLCRRTPHLVKGGGEEEGEKAVSLGEVEVTVCKEKDNENGNLPFTPLPPPPLQGTRPTQSVKPLKGIRKQLGGGGGGGGQKKRVRL